MDLNPTLVTITLAATTAAWGLLLWQIRRLYKRSDDADKRLKHLEKANEGLKSTVVDLSGKCSEQYLERVVTAAVRQGFLEFELKLLNQGRIRPLNDEG